MEHWLEPILDDEPAISSKPINGTLFDISAAAKKNGNQLRYQYLNPKYSKHNINSSGNWRCGSCKKLNFPRRIVCFECNEPKKGNSQSRNIPPNAVALLYPKGSPDPDPYANRTVILSKEGFHVAEKPKSRRQALMQEALKREATSLGSIKNQPDEVAEVSTLDHQPKPNNATDCNKVNDIVSQNVKKNCVFTKKFLVNIQFLVRN